MRSAAASLEMVRVPGGALALRDEAHHTVRTVKVAAFELATVPVTCALWDEVTGHRSAPAARAHLPRTDATWLEAVRFCDALSEQEGRPPCYRDVDAPDAEGAACDFAAPGYRLPTEAEWELACRAGSDDVRYGALDDIAWYRDNAGDRLHPVGEKTPNALGLFDMLGNTWEWCWDLYDPAVYGPYRVFRGGGFADPPRGVRASCRRKSHPTFAIDDLGFRLARTVA